MVESKEKKEKKERSPSVPEYNVYMKVSKVLLGSAMNMATKFSNNGLAEANMVFEMDGIAMFGINEDKYAASMVFISKKKLTEYNLPIVLRKTFDEDLKISIESFMKSGDEEEMEMKLVGNKLKLKCGNLKKTIIWPEEAGYQGNAEKALKTCQAIMNKETVLGIIETKNINDYIHGASSFAGDGGRVTTFRLEKKKMEISTLIHDNDELILNLEEEIKECSAEKLKVTLDTKDVGIMFKRIAKLAESITLIGGTDAPLILTMHGTAPEEAFDFTEDMEFYLMIAPRVGDD